ncbi:MAG: IS1182 family transposase [Acidobacteriota bacterium]
MSREIRADYDQLLMFPPSVEDWIGPDHPARFIRDFVDSLDLGVMGFRVECSETGRPPYAADLLLKAWLYGYLNRIRSSRKLEKACQEHMGLIWLTGMIAPDHNALWRFCHSNRQALSQVFKRSVQVARRCELIGLVVHALDGTKVQARSSRDRVKNAQKLEKMLERLDRSVADYMTEIERSEQEGTGEYRLPAGLQNGLRRKDKIQKALMELEESGRKVVHHCEPEARFMKHRRSLELSYNAQAVADRDSGMIVAHDVVNEETDNGQLVPMLDLVVENLGAVAQETVADGGYFASSQIGLAQERKYEVLVNRSPGEEAAERGCATDPYHASRFIYDDDRDCCICPQGKDLPLLQRKKKGRNQSGIRRYRCRDYEQCPVRWECSKSKHGRNIDISEHEGALQRLREKREDPEKKKLLKARKSIIEPLFAWIKRILGFRRWTVWGLEGAKAQWSMVCTVINLMKLYPHWITGRVAFTKS